MEPQASFLLATPLSFLHPLLPIRPHPLVSSESGQGWAGPWSRGSSGNPRRMRNARIVSADRCRSDPGSGQRTGRVEGGGDAFHHHCPHPVTGAACGRWPRSVMLSVVESRAQSQVLSWRHSQKGEGEGMSQPDASVRAPQVRGQCPAGAESHMLSRVRTAGRPPASGQRDTVQGTEAAPRVHPCPLPGSETRELCTQSRHLPKAWPE